MADPTERIRLRAFEIWEQDGMPEGRHEEHWLQATAPHSPPSALSNHNSRQRDRGFASARTGIPVPGGGPVHQDLRPP
ncbi:DUF2934 domain-containing protein [Rhizobium sp. TRM96647]|uniref:DUF2934 domain-containing protein n=1 Tax=unclassified Rhizobium TaxID=2613769 RepID=UPI0021E75659|nr:MULTISPECIES: DUF2934 domain-containing protein [unclassified Rhizobium]MCV3738738.1 DUF2934 domain-containing protein [Rhizobium sp. TRM96647]MCV3760425.1 DUF2934 domain-containing protein [Rhizobium sp. TRM96650]